jgi:hypothetical protein
VTADPVGDITAIITIPDQRIEVKASATNEGGNVGAPRRPDDDFGVVGVPPAGHLQRHQSGQLIGGTRDAASAQDKTDSTHRRLSIEARGGIARVAR